MTDLSDFLKRIRERALAQEKAEQELLLSTILLHIGYARLVWEMHHNWHTHRKG